MTKLREHQKFQRISLSKGMVPRETYLQELTGLCLMRPRESSHKKPVKQSPNKALKTRGGLVQCPYCRKIKSQGEHMLEKSKEMLEVWKFKVSDKEVLFDKGKS